MVLCLQSSLQSRSSTLSISRTCLHPQYSRQIHPAPPHQLGDRLRRQAAGDSELFDEGAAQVKRLLDRDRKEVLKEKDQVAEFDVEFDRPAGSSNGSGKASTSNSSIDEELSSLKSPMKNAFKSVPKRGAFGSSIKSPFGADDSNTIGQKDMWANMEPVEEDEAPWWTQISLAQVVIALSFVTVIALMLATTWVTVKLGAVHFNE